MQVSNFSPRIGSHSCITHVLRHLSPSLRPRCRYFGTGSVDHSGDALAKEEVVAEHFAVRGHDFRRSASAGV